MKNVYPQNIEKNRKRDKRELLKERFFLKFQEIVSKRSFLFGCLFGLIIIIYRNL